MVGKSFVQQHFDWLDFRKCSSFLLLTVFTYVLVGFVFVYWQIIPSGDTICQDGSQKNHRKDKYPDFLKDKKAVLFATRWWQDRFPFLNETNAFCPNCFFTQDRSLWGRADAVIFHGVFMPSQVPVYRPENQIWVYMIFETGTYGLQAQRKRKMYQNRFNWTMTYRRDSDIYAPYGRFIKKKDVKTPVPEDIWAFTPAIDGTPLAYSLNIPKADAVKSRKTIAWITSRCNTGVKREKLADELDQLIPIDIYGNCGKFDCTVSKYHAKSGVDCRIEISSQYKFYLAFENSHCEDYITEKFFDTLLTDMVPIVYGGADYSYFPKKSYIDVRDFNSIKELADYISYLDRNVTAYLEYFAWRKDYWVQNNRFVTGFCELCSRLWEQDVTREKKIIPDIFEWWGMSGQINSLKACHKNIPPFLKKLK